MKLGDAPPDAEHIHARRMEALRMRSKHYTYQEIGDALGVSAVQAYRDVKARLAEVVASEVASTEEWRQLELDRLDRIARRLESFVDRDIPSLDHVETYLKIMTRRAKLLGLEAPQMRKVEITDGSDARQITDTALLERLKLLQERLIAIGIPVPQMLQEAQNAAIDAEIVNEEAKTTALVLVHSKEKG